MGKLGYFSKTGNEYIIQKTDVPRPLMNYMWNERFLSGVNHFGGGTGAHGNRAASYIDPEGKGRASVIRNGNRYFYIRDASSGLFWNPGWYPVKRELDTYQCTHGLGYTLIESSFAGISSSLRIFVHTKYPVEVCTVTLKNTMPDNREIQLFSFVEFSLDGYTAHSEYDSYVSAEFDARYHMIFANNKAQERPHSWYNGFIASSAEVSNYDSGLKAFLGNYGEIGAPLAVVNGECSNSLATCENMAGVLNNTFLLSPGSTVEVSILIGAADSKETAADFIKEIFAPGKIKMEFESLSALKHEENQCVMIDTPDKNLNHIMNYWAKQQIQLCAEAGRANMKGFRDQLQDAWAVASFNHDMAKTKIIETLCHQYSDGHCVRGWLPLDTRNYSDSPVWIAPTINAYIKESGDFLFLQEEVPYLDGGKGTVWQHILAAVRYSAGDIGKHGLVLAHDGDWNDSLNRMGIGGKGESVWTSIALCLALKNTAEIAEFLLHDEDVVSEMNQHEQRIRQAVNEWGWDGQWYLAGYTDNGEKVGSQNNEEGKIYLNSQTWAILAGISDADRTAKCKAAVDAFLDSDYGPLTLYPPYTQYAPEIGRLTGFVPGIWENGTPYCHGGAFKVVSDCVLGDGDAAYETVKKIMPDSSLNPSEYSGCEPYAFTNMYFGPDNPRKGQTSFAWITGTAGWMFRAVTQYMLGFFPGYETVTVNPCIPKAWIKCSLKRIFRGDTYILNITRDSEAKARMVLDGRKLQENTFKIIGDGCEHKIEIFVP